MGWDEMGYAFISYSTQNQQAADSIRHLFLENDIDVWMAPYDIPADGKYAAAITKAIRECSCFVLLLSNASQESEAVDSEVQLAAVTFKKTVITIQLEDVVLNNSFTFYIMNKQIIPIRNIDKESSEIKKILASAVSFAGKKENTGGSLQWGEQLVDNRYKVTMKSVIEPFSAYDLKTQSDVAIMFLKSSYPQVIKANNVISQIDNPFCERFTM